MKFQLNKEKLIVTPETEFEKKYIEGNFGEGGSLYGRQIWEVDWHYEKNEEDSNYEKPYLLFRKVADSRKDLLKED